MQHSPLIEKYLSTLQGLSADKKSTVLDLACGQGRNGLYLIAHDILTTFADINNEALEQVVQSLVPLPINKQALAHQWQVDFEQENSMPLQGKSFAAILVFRYLHRPLFAQIKQAIQPGGMIIYETFTEQQAKFGRPKNPDFLLKPKELVEIFADWRVLHRFEGLVNTVNENQQAIAQIVAIKPN